MILAGHYHSTTFQLLDDFEIPVLVNPSLSPIYGNNPGVRLLALESNASNYSDYFIDLVSDSEEWKWEYTFSKTFGSGNLQFR